MSTLSCPFLPHLVAYRLVDLKAFPLVSRGAQEGDLPVHLITKKGSDDC